MSNKAHQITKEELVNTVTDLVVNQGYTRFPKGVLYQGEGMSIYEWAQNKFSSEITKEEVRGWFKLPELSKVRTKKVRVNTVQILENTNNSAA